MDAATFRKLGHELVEWVAAYREGLERLMGATCAMCDDIGPMLAAVYGGSTPLQPIPETTDEDAA